MSDLISRDAAIKAIGERDPNSGVDAVTVLNKLPSVNTESHRINTENGKVSEKSVKALERYDDLVEFFGGEEEAGTTLTDRKEFKAWLERMHWHVMEVDKLSKEMSEKSAFIGYRECADAMMKMWMDNVLTDAEYYRIMDRMNRRRGETE